MLKNDRKIWNTLYWTCLVALIRCHATNLLIKYEGRSLTLWCRYFAWQNVKKDSYNETNFDRCFLLLQELVSVDSNTSYTLFALCICTFWTYLGSLTEFDRNLMYIIDQISYGKSKIQFPFISHFLPTKMLLDITSSLWHYISNGPCSIFSNAF